MMSKIFIYIRNSLLLMLGWTIVIAQSERSRFRSFLSKPKLIASKDYDSQPILLLALFQKGEIRPDINNLIKRAQAAGFYVMGVNTQQISSVEIKQLNFDCYIERENFGRDFGSYKEGLRFINKKRMHLSCPRLLIMNDSVLYLRHGLTDFLKNLKTSELEVLGATETYDVNYHLGSFCLSICNEVLNNKAFWNFWSKYKLTDVRPFVISRGEAMLTKTLAKCASSDSKIGALYDSNYFLKRMNEDDDYVEQAIQCSRKSDLVQWQRFDPVELAKRISISIPKIYDIALDPNTSVQLAVEFPASEQKHSVTTLDDIIKFVTYNVTNQNPQTANLIKRQVIASLAENFRIGSQIHQNAAILVQLGLPVVKLDLLYRGMYDLNDLAILTDRLNNDDRLDVMRMLMSRPHGSQTLKGWKQVCFAHGLI
jgi:hypothetical protein